MPAAATTEQRALLGRLLRRSTGGGLADRPRLAVVDALTIPTGLTATTIPPPC